jgi:DNA-binding transcriptional ArsR family regulator
MGHGVDGRPGRAIVDPATASEVARAMQALASPSRVRLLARLREGGCAVGDLAAAAGLSPSAASHQLRILRHLGWVVGRREGRRIVYAMHDDHVAELLDQAVFHVEHLRLGRRGAARAS